MNRWMPPLNARQNLMSTATRPPSLPRSGSGRVSAECCDEASEVVRRLPRDLQCRLRGGAAAGDGGMPGGVLGKNAAVVQSSLVRSIVIPEK
eukprot:SAG22_NODE_171_length_16646_cov_6.580528_11_plen_92_part_00